MELKKIVLLALMGSAFSPIIGQVNPNAGSSVLIGTAGHLVGKISVPADSTPSLHYGVGTTTSTTDYLVVTSGGLVGIGATVIPTERLHVQGNVLSEGDLIFKANSGKGIVFEDGSKVISLSDITSQLAQNAWLDVYSQYIHHTGKVLVGNAISRSFPADFALAVNGKVLATEVLVRKYTNWQDLPDYVFEKQYKLMSLPELESYVQTNKHLPEVPSAKEMAEQGVPLAELNVLLLKKVEELTLYVIEQNKRLDKQTKELEALKAKVR